MDDSKLVSPELEPRRLSNTLYLSSIWGLSGFNTVLLPEVRPAVAVSESEPAILSALYLSEVDELEC